MVVRVGHEHAYAAFALHHLTRANVLDGPLEQTAEDAVDDAPKESPQREAQDEGAALVAGPRGGAAAGEAADGLVGAQRESEHRGRDDDDAPEQPGEQPGEADAAVGAAGHLAEVQAGDEARLAGRQDAELRAERVGGHAGVVGDDTDDEEIAAPLKAQAAEPRVGTGPGGGGQGLLAGVQLVGMQQAEDGGCQGIGQDLDVVPGPFAARGAAGMQREGGLDILLDLRRGETAVG